jgi:hypothetical protein
MIILNLTIDLKILLYYIPTTFNNKDYSTMLINVRKLVLNWLMINCFEEINNAISPLRQLALQKTTVGQ